MSAIITKRVYPYAVGRVDQPGRGTWIDPENAMDPDNGLYAYRFNDGSLSYGYQSYLMKLEIPTMANIVAARWAVRGRLEAEEGELSSIMLYSMFWFDAAGALQSARLDTPGPIGTDWTTSIVDCTFGDFRLVRMLNDLREIRDFFSIEARANNASSQIPGESTIYCDWLALEFDYTLPEFPLQVDLRIE